MAYIQRHETYCGRVNPIVEWRIVLNGRVLREFKTKREALEWLPIFNMIKG